VKGFDAADVAGDISRAADRIAEEYAALKDQLDEMQSERDGAREEVEELKERVAELEKEEG
jgi:polyhydroxyalkanoate synthesis regulator phasin